MSTVLTEQRLAAKLAEPRPVRAHAGGRGELSRREREVLALAAQGLTRTEIAEVLSVALETVKSHAVHILAKLEARNMPHAVARAYELGVFACDICGCGGLPECQRCSPGD